MNESFIFETGATSAILNDLIITCDSVRHLSDKANAIYKSGMLDFTMYRIECIAYYNKFCGKINLTSEQKN